MAKNSQELTESEVLKIFGLKSPEYKAEKKYNTNAAKSESKKHNTQLYEWVIKKKQGDHYIEIPKNQYVIKGGDAVNSCAVKGDNGIIIIRPMKLAEMSNGGNPLSIGNGSSETNETNDNDQGEYMNGTQFEVSGYGGKDEEIIQRISFIKLCLMKECYEFFGEVL